MNAIRQTQQLNKRELENATPPSASWHADYRDTAWVYIGGLPLDLTEGDAVTIFSQFGNPTHLNLIRDRETGKSKGFGFLKYEDQRSCDLAVDNLTGAEVLGRLLRVDHTRYKKKDDEDEDTYRIDRLEAEAEARLRLPTKRASDTEDDTDDERKRRKRRRAVKDDDERLAITAHGDDDEDPMKDYLRENKRSRHRHNEGRERAHGHRRRHREDRDRDDRDEDSREHCRRRSDYRDRENQSEVDSDGDRRHKVRNSKPESLERRGPSRRHDSGSEHEGQAARGHRSKRISRPRSRSRSDDEVLFSGRRRDHDDYRDKNHHTSRRRQRNDSD